MAKRIGDLLLEESIITQEQLSKAIEDQQKSGEPLGRILIKLGFITEEALYYFLAIQFGCEYRDIAEIQIPEDTIKLIKKEVAEELGIIPVEYAKNRIVFATSEPNDHLILRIREKTALPEGSIILF